MGPPIRTCKAAICCGWFEEADLDGAGVCRSCSLLLQRREWAAHGLKLRDAQRGWDMELERRAEKRRRVLNPLIGLHPDTPTPREQEIAAAEQQEAAAAAASDPVEKQEEEERQIDQLLWILAREPGWWGRGLASEAARDSL